MSSVAVIPCSPQLLRMLRSLHHPLSIESPGDDAPFTLAGAAVAVHGNERVGVIDVVVDGERIPGDWHVRNGICTAFRISPLGVERAVQVGSVSVVEKTVVCPTDPALAIEWLANADVELVFTDSHRIRLDARQPYLQLLSFGAQPATSADAWLRMHQAAAQRREAEQVHTGFPAPELNAAVGWAHFRLSNSRSGCAAAHAGEWEDFTRGNTRAATERWLALARSCFQHEKGAWPETPGQSAADLIGGLVGGMLGLQGDTARERLRLRPQFPAEFDHASVSNLRVGDALIEVELQRFTSGIRFSVAQLAGAYPLRLIFEPTLTEMPSRVEIDGRGAELDLVPFGERVVAPVQIMLDDRRTVTFFS